MNTVIITQNAICCFSDNRVHMNRVDCFYIWVFIHYAADSTEHMLHRFTQIFTTVCCNHNQAAICCPFQLWMSIICADGSFEGINCRISRNIDVCRLLPFSQEISLGHLGRSKVKLGNNANCLTVELFGVRGIDVVSAQTSLYMSHSDSEIKAS